MTPWFLSALVSAFAHARARWFMHWLLPCADYNTVGTPTYKYTYRASDLSPAGSSEFVFDPYADADDNAVDFGKRPNCDVVTSTDGSDVCPAGCDDSSGCTGTATVHYQLSSLCPGSTAEDCTPTNNDRSAGCCDKNIRTYHDTTREAVGVPTTLTDWTTYNHRIRPWYTEELARTGDAGWSSVCALNVPTFH